jgi:alkylation response protein AidB-like acyl-CoA dehydrogenase
MKFTPEHEALRQTWKTLIDREINPHVDQWEKDGQFPAHELFKKMGDAGLLGVDKPVEFGGSGLDFSYAMVCAESLGWVNGGSIPMATGVQISMATPALARYGSDELRREFLAPSITGDYVACLGVSETGAGSDVASIKTTARRVGGDWVINGGKMWTTNGAQADWMCLLASTDDGPAHKNKSLIVVPMKTKGIEIVKKLDKLGMRASDTVQTFFDEVKVPVRYTIGQPGHGVHLPDAAVPGGAAVGRRGLAQHLRADHQCDHRIHARTQGLRQASARQSGDPFPPGRAQERGRGVALDRLSRLRGLSRRQGRHHACLDGHRGRDQSPCRRMGEGRHLPGARAVQEARRSWPPRPQQAGRVWRQGLDYSYAMMMAEELGAITCGGVPMAIGVQTDMATPALARFGSDEVRREFLVPTIAGDQVACIGVSEPGAGSDVASIKTTARSDGDDYVINGGKMWITNGTQADWICLLANTGDGPVHRNKSLICVPMKSKGVQVARKLDKLGMRSSDTAQIFFDDVGAEAQPDRRGRPGLHLPDDQFQEERLWGAAACLKAHEFIIDETIDYTRDRKAFGGSILDNQVVHFKLAEMQTEVELLRSLIYRACRGARRGEDVTMLATDGEAEGRPARPRAHRRLPAILGRHGLY